MALGGLLLKQSIEVMLEGEGSTSVIRAVALGDADQHFDFVTLQDHIGQRTTSEVEVVEEKKGMGWEGGVAVFTTLVLLAACLCVDYDLGHKFNEGMFFKH